MQHYFIIAYIRDTLTTSNTRVNASRVRTLKGRSNYDIPRRSPNKLGSPRVDSISQASHRIGFSGGRSQVRYYSEM